MNIDFDQAREQLRALHQRELDGLSAFEAAVGRARQFGLYASASPAPLSLPIHNAKVRTKRGRPAKEEKPARPAISARTRAGGRGETTERFRVVVAELTEPFNVASAEAAFLVAHPDREEWTVNIANALYRWKDEGLLERTSGGGHWEPRQLQAHETVEQGRCAALGEGTGLHGFPQHHHHAQDGGGIMKHLLAFSLIAASLAGIITTLVSQQGETERAVGRRALGWFALLELAALGLWLLLS